MSEALGVTDVRYEDLLTQAQSKVGSEELFELYPPTKGTERVG